MASAPSVVPLIDANHDDSDSYSLSSIHYSSLPLPRAESPASDIHLGSRGFGRGVVASIAVAATFFVILSGVAFYWVRRCRMRRSESSQWIKRHEGRWKRIGTSKHGPFLRIFDIKSLVPLGHTSSPTNSNEQYTAPPVFSKFALYKPAPILPVFARFASRKCEDDLPTPMTGSSEGMASVDVSPTTYFTSVLASPGWGSRCASDAATVRIPDPPMTPLTRHSSFSRGSGLYVIPENFVS